MSDGPKPIETVGAITAGSLAGAALGVAVTGGAALPLIVAGGIIAGLTQLVSSKRK